MALALLARGPDEQTENHTNWTMEFAEAYLNARPTFLAEDTQNHAQPIRAKIASNGPVSPHEMVTLYRCYFNAGHFAEYASPVVFRKITVDHLDLWIEHVADCSKILITDPRYIQTGVIPEHDGRMLFAMVSFAKHYSVVERLLHANFLRVLSDLCAACKAPRMPSPIVAEAICLIWNNVRAASINHDQGKAREIVLQLERSGLLRQTIRCLTVPFRNGREEGKYMYRELDLICNDCISICKVFRKGRKTGDVLSAVLEGRDGFTGERDPQIMFGLTNLARLCHYANPEGSGDNSRYCRKCKKNGMRLLCCVGCDGTFP